MVENVVSFGVKHGILCWHLHTIVLVDLVCNIYLRFTFSHKNTCKHQQTLTRHNAR